MSSERNHYEVLGVSRNASADVIRQAYKRIAREFHPDRKGEEYKEVFQRAQAAYSILSDETNRQMYNLTLDESSTFDENIDYENMNMGELGKYDSDTESESDEETEYTFYSHENINYLVPDGKFDLERAKDLELDEFGELIKINSVYKITDVELSQIETDLGKINAKGEYTFMYPSLYVMRKRLDLAKNQYIAGLV